MDMMSLNTTLRQGGRGTPTLFLERGRGYPPLMLRDRPPPPYPEQAG